MSAKYKSASIQAVRFFVAAFVAVYPASNLIGAASGSQPLDTSALRAAAVAGVAAIIAWVWRAWAPQTPLTDKNPAS